MAIVGVVLASNVSATGAQAWQTFKGGPASLTVNAIAYPATLNLEVMSGTNPVIVNSNVIAADGVWSYALPAGQYRVNLSGGSPSGVYANLQSIPFTT